MTDGEFSEDDLIEPENVTVDEDGRIVLEDGATEGTTGVKMEALWTDD